MKMTFGKYGPAHFSPNGVSIEFINSGYLKWLMQADWFIMSTKHEDLRCAVEAELVNRDDWDAHFWKDKVVVSS